MAVEAAVGQARLLHQLGHAHPVDAVAAHTCRGNADDPVMTRRLVRLRTTHDRTSSPPAPPSPAKIIDVILEGADDDCRVSAPPCSRSPAGCCSQRWGTIRYFSPVACRA